MKLAQAAAIDVVCILLFAVLGRGTHNETNDLLGVWTTAWPFLAGCLIGHLLARSWRHPAGRTTGIIIWVATVAGGLGLRVLSGDTAQWPFIIVATIVLALLLVGWRLAYRLIDRARHRHHTRAAH